MTGLLQCGLYMKQHTYTRAHTQPHTLGLYLPGHRKRTSKTHSKPIIAVSSGGRRGSVWELGPRVRVVTKSTLAVSSTFFPFFEENLFIYHLEN